MGSLSPKGAVRPRRDELTFVRSADLWVGRRLTRSLTVSPVAARKRRRRRSRSLKTVRLLALALPPPGARGKVQVFLVRTRSTGRRSSRACLQRRPRSCRGPDGSACRPGGEVDHEPDAYRDRWNDLFLPGHFRRGDRHRPAQRQLYDRYQPDLGDRGNRRRQRPCDDRGRREPRPGSAAQVRFSLSTASTAVGGPAFRTRSG